MDLSRISENIRNVRAHIPAGVTLVCVSKFQPIQAIQEAYNAGERHFGESRVQELKQKVTQLPNDIQWHFIGHLQTNKVRDLLKLKPYIRREKCGQLVWSETRFGFFLCHMHFQ